jgi:predicted metal-dependent peptidase
MIDEERFRLYHDAVAYLVNNSPSFDLLSDFLETVPLENGDGVAATDGRKFYIGPEFSKYSTDQRAFIIAHELNHIVHRHPWRSVGKNHDLWNIAGDFVINDVLHLREIPNISLPGKPISLAEVLGTAKGNDLEVPPNAVEGILYDPSIEPLTTDEIYRMLENEAQKKGMGNPQIGNKQAGDINGDDVIPNDDPASEEETSRKLQDAARKYMDRHPEKGEDENIRRILKELDVSLNLPWQTILQRYLKKIVAGDYTWAPPRSLIYPNMKEPIYLPRLRSKTIRIAVAVDTSGSIGEKDLAVFLGNINALFNAILSQVGYKGLFMLTTDSVYWYKLMPPVPSDTEVITNLEGGGTDFKPAFDMIGKTMLESPDLFVYFTDGEGDFPSIAPNYPVLWVLVKDNPVPFGEAIRFEL